MVEEKTQKFWKENKVFEKSVSNPTGLKKPKGNYVFYYPCVESYLFLD